ncbi:MAG TPA: cytochrome c [Bryobacteraceae bacterium]
MSIRASRILLLAVVLPAFSGAAELAGNKPATFAKDIQPILQEKCQNCHREGSTAPMSLLTYEQTRPWAKAIKERVVSRTMPPWHLDKTVGIQEFQNDMSLSEEQIRTIARWVDGGAPLGDPKDLLPLKQWPKDDGWQLSKQFGAPDMILTSEAYTMPAKGQDVWFKPLTMIPLDEPRWVRAVEMRPASAAGRKITHHALAYLQQEEPGTNTGIASQGLLMEWAMNKNYDIYRPNTGKLLVPGARIWWEMHYHAVGEEIRDHVELAVYLYPKGQEPKYRTYLTAFQATPGSAAGGTLDIPPNSIAQTEGYQVLKSAARLENFQPHMHLRGKAMLIEALLPDGSKRTLSYVDHFNFNWMTNYIYSDDAAPVLPKGTIIHVTAWHDNTVNNKNNPDPNQWVGWGDRTVDEMAHAWVNVTNISDEDYQEWAAKHKPATSASAASAAARQQ